MCFFYYHHFQIASKCKKKKKPNRNLGNIWILRTNKTTVSFTRATWFPLIHFAFVWSNSFFIHCCSAAISIEIQYFQIRLTIFRPSFHILAIRNLFEQKQHFLNQIPNIHLKHCSYSLWEHELFTRREMLYCNNYRDWKSSKMYFLIWTNWNNFVHIATASCRHFRKFSANLSTIIRSTQNHLYLTKIQPNAQT